MQAEILPEKAVPAVQIVLPAILPAILPALAVQAVLRVQVPPAMNLAPEAIQEFS